MTKLSSWSSRRSARIVVLTLLLGAAACGEEDPGSVDGQSGAAGAAGGPSAAGENGGGQIMCGIFTCEAGQHCNNGVCVNGCLTTANCLQKQTCEDIDSSTQIGTCRDMSVAPEKDCEAFCDKALACMDPDARLCDQQCKALSIGCVSCVIDSNCGVGCEEVCEL